MAMLVCRGPEAVTPFGKLTDDNSTSLPRASTENSVLSALLAILVPSWGHVEKQWRQLHEWVLCTERRTLR